MSSRGKDHWLSNQGFSGEITVLSIVDSYRLLVKFFQSVYTVPPTPCGALWLSRSSVAQVHPKSSTKCPEAVDQNIDNACGSTRHQRLVKLVRYCPYQRKRHRYCGRTNRASAAGFSVQSAIEQHGEDKVFEPMTELANDKLHGRYLLRGNARKEPVQQRSQYSRRLRRCKVLGGK